ncbi:MAG: ferritin-like domain-containing protein [Rhodospirillales bacterium]
MMDREPEWANLASAAVKVIGTADPDDKVRLTVEIASLWRNRRLRVVGRCRPPNHPTRPAHPELCAPGEMPRRRKGTLAGRQAFVHAIAHIELNAIDLAWDIVARFTDDDLPTAFYDDWVQVALDEALHFQVLRQRLRALGTDYGALPAHNGLWEAAERTADDLLARLALVPMVLEARGLDTTPRAVRDLTEFGDEDTASILERIGREEVPHVAAGVQWFEHICKRRHLDPIPTFHKLVRQRFAGNIKPPFNRDLRDAAGMDIGYYEPLAVGAEGSSNEVNRRAAES